MSLNVLPNTALAASVVNNTSIYTYLQTYHGEIFEIKGNLNGSALTYQVNGDPVGLDFTKSKGKAPAKRFTPLAAVYYKTRRTVFYVDKENYLRDGYYQNGSWNEGVIYQKKWKCAAYSKLAAIRLTDTKEYICLYYQDTSDTGDIKHVKYSDEGGWREGDPPVDDPPLYGTFMSAVPPEPGIEVKTDTGNTDTKDPVLFFQYDKLELGSSQDQGENDFATYYITNKYKTLSAHTALAALDDGNNFWCFYTCDTNQVERLRVDAKGNITQPQTVPLDVTPIPASALSAVLVKTSSATKVVLFYLLHYESLRKTTQEINVFATTLTAKSADSVDTWDVSGRVCLT